MTLLKKLWKSIKRNPVLNAFALAVATQFWQDYVLGKVDWAHIFGYLFTLMLGVIARFFTVPESEHELTKQRVSDAIIRLEADYQRRRFGDK